jgi:hypothetical protein
MCVGFWVGVFELSVVNLFICGCISSGTSYILNMIFADSGIKLDIKEGRHV